MPHCGLGAAGFVVKTAPTAELLDAIRRGRGRRPRYSVSGRAQGVALSGREREVLRRVVDGASNDEIGAALGAERRTVESHLRRLFEHHDVASRTELAARAIREGWLEDAG